MLSEGEERREGRSAAVGEIVEGLVCNFVYDRHIQLSTWQPLWWPTQHRRCGSPNKGEAREKRA